MLAGSIRRNILDENVCKAIIIDDVLFADEKGKPLIEQLRKTTGDDDFFCEMRWLADRWRANPKLEKESFWLFEVLREVRKV